MSLLAAGQPGNNPRPAWTDEIRHQARVAVRIAAMNRLYGDRALRYYICAALAHGLTVQEVCEAGHLQPSDVLALSDPAAI